MVHGAIPVAVSPTSQARYQTFAITTVTVSQTSASTTAAVSQTSAITTVAVSQTSAITTVTVSQTSAIKRQTASEPSRIQWVERKQTVDACAVEALVHHPKHRSLPALYGNPNSSCTNGEQCTLHSPSLGFEGAKLAHHGRLMTTTVIAK